MEKEQKQTEQTGQAEQEVKASGPQYKILRVGMDPVVISADNYPKTNSLIQENLERLPAKYEDTIYKDRIREFYFVESEWNEFRDELTTPDYNYNGMNIYMPDEKTVAFQIVKMF